MVVGTGGAGFTKNAESPGPDWNELFFYQWGYARVTALNSSYLNWEWVNSTTGTVIDHMMIYQDDATQSWVTSSNDNDGDDNNSFSIMWIIIVTLSCFLVLTLLVVSTVLYARRVKIDYDDGLDRNLLTSSHEVSTNPV